jgi:hypothetical protein
VLQMGHNATISPGVAEKGIFAMRMRR